MENNKTPKIRFKGFTDDWEQRELGEVATEIVAGGDIEKDMISDIGEYPVIANALTNDGIVGYYSDNFRIKAPAVTVTGRGDVGHAKARTVDFTPVVRLITIMSKLDSHFLENRINTLNIMVESTGVPQLTVPQLSKYNISYPTNKVEQTKIGTFFKTLDNLITCHQHKCDKLVNVKKSMLEKMFPKNGEKIPEIRFKGFTDAWEQRELGEVFEERTERSSDGELISVTINSGIKKFSELNRHDNSSDDKSNYKVVCENDIAYNSMRMWQGASGYSPYNGIVSPAYTVLAPHEDINSVFFSYMFKKSEMIQTFQVRSQGITSDTWNLKYPAFSKIEVLKPKYSEQTKIGTFFKTLDNLITCHQRELEKLKNIKKSLLEKMFV